MVNEVRFVSAVIAMVFSHLSAKVFTQSVFKFCLTGTC